MVFDLIIIDNILSYFPIDMTLHQLKYTLNMLLEMKDYYESKLLTRQCIIILTESKEILDGLPLNLKTVLESFCHVTMSMQSIKGKSLIN